MTWTTNTLVINLDEHCNRNRLHQILGKIQGILDYMTLNKLSIVSIKLQTL